MQHFRQLLDDLKQIHQRDPNIALHVVDFCTTTADNLQRLTQDLPFHCRFWQIQHEFCNGMGHNVCIRHIKDKTALVAVIAVDLQMPANITAKIRKYAVPGRSFYGPMISYQCKDGSLKRDSAAYALIAAGRTDFQRVGKLRQNMLWGGDKREGGEDTQLMKQFRKQVKLKQHRAFHPRLICRWHPRDVTQRFYQSYHRYYQMPWWNLVDNQGNPIAKKKANEGG